MLPDLALYSTSYLSEKTLSILFEGCEEITLRKNELVYVPGDQCRNTYLVTKGKLMTYKFAYDGKQIFDSIYRENSTVGFRDSFSSSQHMAYCKVLEDAVLLQCPIPLFIERANKNLLWVEIVQGEMKKTTQGIRPYKTASKEELFHRIRIMENEGLTQNEMAMILGYSRVQITRLVNEMYHSKKTE